VTAWQTQAIDAARKGPIVCINLNVDRLARRISANWCVHCCGQSRYPSFDGAFKTSAKDPWPRRARGNSRIEGSLLLLQVGTGLLRHYETTR
jgi:hypothetical protein